MLQVGVRARAARVAGSVALVTHVNLCVLITYPDGPVGFVRQVDWPMPLPVVGDGVALGTSLGVEPVVDRVFMTEEQRVTLMFSIGPADERDWPVMLEAAGYARTSLVAKRSRSARG